MIIVAYLFLAFMAAVMAYSVWVDWRSEKEKLVAQQMFASFRDNQRRAALATKPTLKMIRGGK